MATTVSGQDVADFLGQGDDVELVALATEHVAIMTAIVSGYTRGKGIDTGIIEDDLAAVITTATARSVVNPDSNKREAIGDYTVTPAAAGFTLAETFILNRYRKRAA